MINRPVAMLLVALSVGGIAASGRAGRAGHDSSGLPSTVSPSPTPTGLFPTPIPSPSPTQPEPIARHLSLELHKHLLALGRLTSAPHQPGCVVGKKVRIERKAVAHWKQIASTKTTKGGYFRAQLDDLAGDYRAIVAESGGCAGVVSKVRRVTARLRVTMRLSGALTVAGRLSARPRAAHCTRRAALVVERRGAHHWKGVRKVRTDHSGRFSTSVPDDAGRYRTVVNRVSYCSSARSATRYQLYGSSFRQYINSRSGHVSVALFDARDGQTYSFSPGELFDTASIVKVDIMGALMRDAQNSGRSLTGRERRLLTAMIEQSDNNAATSLYHEIGGPPGLDAFDRAAGLHHTYPSSSWGLTRTTAIDQTLLLRHFAFPNSLLDHSHRGYGLNLMEHVVSWEAWGVSAGPSHATVALKNGWLPIGNNGWEINSIGWVSGRHRNYCIAVLTSGNANESYGIETIQGISNMIWSTLAAR